MGTPEAIRTLCTLPGPWHVNAGATRARRRGDCPRQQRYGASCRCCQCHRRTHRAGISGPLSSTQTINRALIRMLPAGWCLGKKKKLFLYPAYLNLQITHELMYTLPWRWPRDKEGFPCPGGRAATRTPIQVLQLPLLHKPQPCRPSGTCCDLPGSSTRPSCRIKAVWVTTLFQ